MTKATVIDAIRVGRGIRFKLLVMLVSSLVWGMSLSSQTLNRGVVRLESNPGTVYRTEIAAGASRHYSLVLKPNEFAQITIDQKGMDLATSVYDPNNKLIHKADWRWSGAESISWVGESGGAYRIHVSALRLKGAPGAFVLKLTQLRARSELDPKWTVVEKNSTEIKDGVDNGVPLAKLAAPVEEALAIWRELDYGPGIAQVLNVRGFVEQNTGKPLVASEILREALAIRRSHQDTAGQAETLHNMASSESLAGEIRKALALYQQALEFRHEAGDVEGLTFTLSNLGYIHSALGENDSAISVLGDAIEASQRIEDLRRESQALINLGAILAAVGETEDALTQFRRASRLLKGTNDTRAEAYVLANLGKIYIDLGDYSRALPNLKRSTELMRSIVDKRGEGAVLLNMGAAYLFSGEPQLAVQSFEQAFAVFRETKNRMLEARALQGLSRAFHSQGESARALKSNTEALVISRSLGDMRAEADALRNLADIELSKQEVNTAIEHLTQAQGIFERVRYRNGEADALLALARISKNSGNHGLALTQIEEALKIIESQREKITSTRLRGSYFASKRQYYGFYIDLLMPAGGPLTEQQAAAALEANERARARLLLDTIPLSRIKVNSPPGRDLDHRQRSLYREINRVAQQLHTAALNETETADRNKRLETLLYDMDDVQAQLRTADPRYQRLISPPILRAAEIQNQLDPETVLLEYSLGEERGFLWAVTTSSVTVFSNLPPRSEVDQLVRSLYDSVSARSRRVANESPSRRKARLDAAYSNYRKTASVLSEKLLGPVADLLTVKRLVIVNDGSLHFVPFAALPAPGDSSGSPLILKHEVVNLPSISVLSALRQEMRTRPRPAGTLALIADPVYSLDDPRAPGVQAKTKNAGKATPQNRSESTVEDDDDDWLEDLRGGTGFRRLIYSRQETRGVLSMVPASQSRVALGFDADLPAVLDSNLASFRIVHFGVHGMFDSVQPSLSSLVLSLIRPDGQPNDGFLRLYQIYNLNLPVDLVVLGACETAMGAEIHGEGVESLARGFMYAGAARLVASLWQVDDESTSELMKVFYRNILKSNLTPSAALRQAQVEMMRNARWRDPYYWAAFVFLGEWR